MQPVSIRKTTYARTRICRLFATNKDEKTQKPPVNIFQEGDKTVVEIDEDYLNAYSTEKVRVKNLVSILDGYFIQGGHHLNINVLNREMLQDAMQNPQNYPNLTIRVSGYAVSFTRLTREQQLDVINRTFHDNVSVF